VNCDLPIEESIVSSDGVFVIAAVGNLPSAGTAAVDSVSARTVCKKISGACPAMPSLGNARTVEGRMDLATNEGICVAGEEGRKRKQKESITTK
jgi:hypothetical protein